MATDKTHKIPNAPNLRFPGFSGEWKESLLQDVATLSKGAGISKEQLSKEGNPCILYGELYTKYNSEVITEIYSRTNVDLKNLVLSKKNDVIIPSSGETAIDISTARCVPFDNIFLGGDLNIIRLNGHDGRFLSYQLNGVRRLDVAKVAQGVSVVHLYGESLRRLKVRFPRNEEQEKIAAFMTVVDERIQTQIGAINKHESLIKAIAGELTCEGEKVRLADLVDCHSSTMQENDITNDGPYPVYGATGICGYTDSPMCKEDAIIIVKDGSGVGNIKFVSGGFSILGTLYYMTAKQDVSIGYVYCCLVNFDFSPYKTGMAIPHIYFKDYGKGKINIKNAAEQQKIRTLVLSLMNKLDVERQLLKQYKLQKQYLLSQMFV